MGNYLIRRLPPDNYIGWKVMGIIKIPQELRHLFPILDCFKLDPLSWPGTVDIVVLPGISERVVLVSPEMTETCLWPDILEQVTKELLVGQLELIMNLLDDTDNLIN